MLPIYENINHNLHTSFNVAQYTHTETCETTNWHIHPEYELVYIRNGKGILRIDNKEYSYSDGVLLLLGPNIPHADFGNKEFKDNKEVVIQFEKKFIDEKLNAFPEFNAVIKLIETSRQGIIFSSATKNNYSHYFEEFTEDSYSRNLITLLTILEKLAKTKEFECIIDQRNLSLYKTSEVERLEQVFEYVNQKYADSVDLLEISNQIGLTKNSFCRFFKKMTKKNFIQFVNEFRVRKAAEKLQSKNVAISEVMYDCGFQDASYFAKVFKQHTSYSPSAYREIQ